MLLPLRRVGMLWRLEKRLDQLRGSCFFPGKGGNGNELMAGVGLYGFFGVVNHFFVS